jgi:hypothetical protein
MSDRDRLMAMSTMVHVRPETTYDVHRQDTGTHVIRLDDPEGTNGVALFFRTLRDLDRFVDAVVDGRDALRGVVTGEDEVDARRARHWDGTSGQDHESYTDDQDHESYTVSTDEDADGPSAEQERGWNEQYDGTSFGA